MKLDISLRIFLSKVLRVAWLFLNVYPKSIEEVSHLKMKLLSKNELEFSVLEDFQPFYSTK
jgi:hypothetical protein